MATDEDLVADFVAGNQAAFAELVERYRRELFSFLQRFINKRALIAIFSGDIIQRLRAASHRRPQMIPRLIGRNGK